MDFESKELGPPIFTKKIRDTTDDAKSFRFVPSQQVIVSKASYLFSHAFGEGGSISNEGLNIGSGSLHITHLAISTNETHGTIIACTLLDGSIGLVSFERWVILALYDPGSWRNSKFSPPSCLALRMRETENDLATCLIFYGDTESKSISVIKPVSVSVAVSVAVVPSLGIPIDVALSTKALIIVGSGGVRVRDLEMMMALPPPGDLASSGSIDPQLAISNTKHFP